MAFAAWIKQAFCESAFVLIGSITSVLTDQLLNSLSQSTGNPLESVCIVMESICKKEKYVLIHPGI